MQRCQMKADCLELVDLDQKKYGYRKFISSWIFRKAGLTCVVDPGPQSTIDRLINRLCERNIAKLDFILLTHIHLDHAGGAGALLNAFPKARIFCHDKGISHLADPSRLWESSCNVHPEDSLLFGRPLPVSLSRLADPATLEDHGIHVIPTPGHAPHHVCFVMDEILFAGEAVGARYLLENGREYLRPTTPPKFIYDIYLRSLNTLMSWHPTPGYIAFGHYGVSGNVLTWCERMKTQLALWIETLARLHQESETLLEERLFHQLMKVDEFYGHGNFDALPEDIQSRERGFLKTTIRGMLGYIQSR